MQLRLRTAYLHRMAKRKPPPNRRSSFVLPNHLRKKKQRIKQPIPGASQPHKPLIDADNARRDETRRDARYTERDERHGPHSDDRSERGGGQERISGSVPRRNRGSDSGCSHPRASGLPPWPLPPSARLSFRRRRFCRNPRSRRSAVGVRSGGRRS